MKKIVSIFLAVSLLCTIGTVDNVLAKESALSEAGNSETELIDEKTELVSEEKKEESLSAEEKTQSETNSADTASTDESGSTADASDAESKTDVDAGDDETTATNETEAAVSFDGGKGTANDPYLISTAEQLLAIHNDLNASYRLCKDIDMSGVENWEPVGGYVLITINSEEEFTDAKSQYGSLYYNPENDLCEYDKVSSWQEGITTYYYYAKYEGRFDGNGYSVCNLTMNARGNEPYYGFFGVFSDEIKNLKLENIKLSYNRVETTQGSNGYIGGIAGYGDGTYTEPAVITNCEVSGTIDANNLYVMNIGGIVGGYTSINHCVNRADISVYSEVNKSRVSCGGISGLSGDALLIENINYGLISAEAYEVYCAGILANGVGGSTIAIRQSVNFGDIYGKAFSVRSTSAGNVETGGISGNGSAVIKQCLNYGNISSVQTSAKMGVCYARGISNGGSNKIKACYNLGKSIIATVTNRDDGADASAIGDASTDSDPFSNCASIVNGR